GLRPGTHVVRVQQGGYEVEQREVVVNAGLPAVVEFSLKTKIVNIGEIIVHARQGMDTKTTENVHRVDKEKLQTLPRVDGFAGVISTLAGVVAKADDIHVHGGRGPERA